MISESLTLSLSQRKPSCHSAIINHAKKVKQKVQSRDSRIRVNHIKHEMNLWIFEACRWREYRGQSWSSPQMFLFAIVRQKGMWMIRERSMEAILLERISKMISIIWTLFWTEITIKLFLFFLFFKYKHMILQAHQVQSTELWKTKFNRETGLTRIPR